jgi:hypothetical protein
VPFFHSSGNFHGSNGLKVDSLRLRLHRWFNISSEFQSSFLGMRGTRIASTTLRRFLAYVLLSGAVPELKNWCRPSFRIGLGATRRTPGRSFFYVTQIVNLTAAAFANRLNPNPQRYPSR